MSRRSLRILSVGPQIPYPANDGGRIGIYEPMRHLAARGHRVAYLGFGEQATAREMAVAGGLSWARAVIHDTRTRPLSALLAIFSRQPFTASKYRAMSMVDTLAEVLAAEPFDLVQFEHTHMGWYLHQVPRGKCALILRLHNVESELQRSYSQQSRPPMSWYVSLQARRLESFEAQTCRGVDACLAITDDDARWVEQHARATRVFVVPAGAFIAKRSRFRSSNEPLVLFVGALDWLPNAQGIRWFAEAVWPSIRRAVPAARCVVIGRNPPWDLRAWGERAPGVQVLGYVEDIREFRGTASLEIAPILSGGGMRVKILDAFGYGNAVVSTSLGAAGIEAVHEKEILIADTAIAFAEQVVRLLTRPGLQREIGDAARSLVVRQYSWEDVAGRMEEAYYSVLSARAGAGGA